MAVKSIAIAIAAVLLGATNAAQAMTFSVIEDQLTMRGPVIPGDYERFMAALAEHPGITTVILMNSPGGDALTSSKIMPEIQQRKFTTGVAGYCISGCTRMFLSGVTRQYTDQTPFSKTYLGFHSNYDSNKKIIRSAVYLLQQQLLSYVPNIDQELMKRWTVIVDAPGRMEFYYAPKVRLGTGVSILLCPVGHGIRCEEIPGKDTLSAGIITSYELTHIKSGREWKNEWTEEKIKTRFGADKFFARVQKEKSSYGYNAKIDFTQFPPQFSLSGSKDIPCESFQIFESLEIKAICGGKVISSVFPDLIVPDVGADISGKFIPEGLRSDYQARREKDQTLSTELYASNSKEPTLNSELYAPESQD